MVKKISAEPPKVSCWKEIATIRQIVFFPTGNISLLSVKLLHVVHDEYLHFGVEINALYVMECLTRLCFWFCFADWRKCNKKEGSRLSPLSYCV